MAYVTPSTFESDMRALLQEAGANSVKTANFKLSGKVISAHHFVVASSSPVLNELISESKSEFVELDVDPDIFSQLLEVMYTNGCDLLRCGFCPKSFSGCEGDSNNNVSPVRKLKEAAERFQVANLASVVNNYRYYNGVVSKHKPNCCETVEVKLNYAEFPNLHDVVIKTKEDREVRAHKCILAARLEYFNNIFSLRWSEVSEDDFSYA